MLLNLKPFWLSNGLLDTDNHQKMIILACVTFYCLCIILLLVCIHNLLFIIVVVIVIIFFLQSAVLKINCPVKIDVYCMNSAKIGGLFIPFLGEF